MANSAKAYSNADAYEYNEGNRLHACAEPYAHDCNQPGSIPVQLRTASANAPSRETTIEAASAIIDHTTPCETMINNAPAINSTITMSSQREW